MNAGSRALITVMAAALLAGGCDLFDPERPTMQPDSVVFGNLLEIGADEEGRTVLVRVGVPRALAKAETSEGKPTPVVEPGLVAEVTLTEDTVVLADGRPARLEDFNPGEEVVALPQPGTTRMVGATRVLFEAGHFLDFATYQHWQLPRLGLPEEDPAGADQINTAGLEHAPAPARGGRVLYFGYRLRRPPEPEAGWVGPVRPGLPAAEVAEGSRPYRSELGPDGWSAPQPVEVPGTEDAAVVRISWISDDETRCLLTVVPAGGGPPRVAVASRGSEQDAWSAAEPVEALAGGDAADAVYLAGSRSKMVFVSTRAGMGGADLFLYDPDVPETPLPLEPRLNTVADEMGPRIGPVGELFFTRADRQLVLTGGTIAAVRLPGPFRQMIVSAAPTSDGQWVFFCAPKYRPVELDLDIWVAPWIEGGKLGPAVPVGEWRPIEG